MAFCSPICSQMQGTINKLHPQLPPHRLRGAGECSWRRWAANKGCTCDGTVSDRIAGMRGQPCHRAIGEAAIESIGAMIIVGVHPWHHHDRGEPHRQHRDDDHDGQRQALFLLASFSALSMAAFTRVAMNSAKGPMSAPMLALSRAFI
jgi:hypothetical protein